MATREEFLRHLWTEIINPVFRDAALDNIISNCKRDLVGPFGDTGPAIERLLAGGIARRHDPLKSASRAMIFAKAGPINSRIHSPSSSQR